MQQADKYLICIAGPTASGKTELAIKVANFFCTEIISCDSRQFYKEMRIGTARPSDQELEEVPHHFIAHKSIFEPYSCGDFEADSLNLLDRLFEKKSVVVMVGGSGLYMNAVLNGIDSFPPIDSELRKGVADDLINKGLPYLLEELARFDPNYYLEVDKSNPQRISRAIEVIRTSGQAYSSFRSGAIKPRNFRAIKLALDWPREELYQRINKRVDTMMDHGLLKEVEELFPYRHINALKTVGYSELFQFIDGIWSLDVAVSKIKQHTRNYAKRQLTWLRREPEFTWFQASQFDKAIAFLHAQCK